GLFDVMEYLRGRYRVNNITSAIRSALLREEKIQRRLEAGGELMIRMPNGDMVIIEQI
ncbi:MAG: hypothetical protein JWN50_229, partial [Parcubacteria group bacterium]|nr:hypothetical protein [Parcubacteria group bacterium]